MPNKPIPPPPDLFDDRPRRRPDAPPAHYPKCACDECIRKVADHDVRHLYTTHDMADAYMRGRAAAFLRKADDGA
jgi:hypothetical protein